MKVKLDRIRKVELRAIWQHEATDFTKWLAEPENLELLSEEIDIELSLIDTEQKVGRFSVDIYAEEPNTGRKIIIENQLEKTDHDHLGKLITYASGLNAEIIVWIVKEVLEEHQQAIEWLNENTGEKINFFAIRMEAWKIGNSNPAPNFHIIAKPNNWAKAVKSSLINNELTEIKELQLNFWGQFKDYVIKNNSGLRLRKIRPQHWYDISIGRSDSNLSLTINSQSKEIACELYISNSKETFETFFKNKIEIEKELGNLIWMELPTKKASRIKLSKKLDFTKEKNWKDCFQWLSETAKKFQDTFTKF